MTTRPQPDNPLHGITLEALYLVIRPARRAEADDGASA